MKNQLPVMAQTNIYFVFDTCVYRSFFTFTAENIKAKQMTLTGIGQRMQFPLPALWFSPTAKFWWRVILTALTLRTSTALPDLTRTAHWTLRLILAAARMARLTDSLCKRTER